MPAKEKKSESPVTLSQLNSQLLEFFKKLLEPRFKAIENRLDKVESRLEQVDGHLVDLYKKFEDLYQEYIVTNYQMKRLEKNDDVLKEDVLELKTKVSNLLRQIEELENRVAVQ